jgi:3-methyladenine DNA glycosylase/8-oxoguanine DNA glycosylase
VTPVGGPAAATPRWRQIGELVLEGAAGEPVDLTRTLASHGVATLPPQLVDPAGGTLETTLARGGGKATAVRIRRAQAGLLAVDVLGERLTAKEQRGLLGVARQILGLDEDLSRFYVLAAADPALAWVGTGAGRMLRSPTVFEDVTKTICTTNCTWSATVRMVTAIVEHLGEPATGGRRAFPGAAAMAAAGEGFYREVARAGYRGSYLLRLATETAEGRLDLEELRDREVHDDEVARRLLALPGVGPYAAAHVMVISLGRYRQLILDSWTRPTYARLTGRKASDATIARRFRRFGDFAGLAFWLFVTRDWVDE